MQYRLQSPFTQQGRVIRATSVAYSYPSRGLHVITRDAFSFNDNDNFNGNTKNNLNNNQSYNLSSIIVFFVFWDDGKIAKSLPLAPIAVKILVARGSSYKIEAESGTTADKKAQSFRS